MAGIINRFIHLFVALDQLAWVLITLGDGYPDETISAALYRMELQGKLAGKLFRPLVDLVFQPFQEEHCKKAYRVEVMKLQLPRSYSTDTNKF